MYSHSEIANLKIPPIRVESEEAQNYIAAGSREAYNHMLKHLGAVNPGLHATKVQIDGLSLQVYISEDLPSNWVIFCAGPKTRAFEIDQRYLSPKAVTLSKSVAVKKEI